MAKIIVPQELRQQIVDLYVNQNKTRVDIKNELNLEFGDSVIKRILVEEGVQIKTNPGAQKGGLKKQEVSQELQEKIIELYGKGYGLNKIVQELELPFSFDKVRSILKDNNIHIRNLHESQKVMTVKDLRTYPVNDEYILESHNGAWLLGFIAADGYLPISHGARNRITISLARQDENVLYMIADEIGYGGKIYQYTSQGFPASSLSFASKPLRQRIESYGIGNNKTFKLYHLPNLPREYMIDFIRGFFDGDGSVYETSGKKISTNFTCASKNFLLEIVDFLEKEYEIPKVSIHSTIRVHKIYSINYGYMSSCKLCDLFYLNDYLALPRKKQHYLELREKYSH